MDTKMFRRRVLAIVPAAALVAITENVDAKRKKRKRGNKNKSKGGDGAKTVALSQQCREFGRPCEGQNQCCDGLSCIEAGGSGAAERCIECNDTTPCPEEKVCVGGACVIPEPPVECEEDKDCPDGEVCVEGVCVPVVVICEDDEDCAEGEVCVEGVCVPEVCKSDEDCPEGEVCILGVCTPDTTCKSDADCPPDGVCVEGTCQYPLPPECKVDADCGAGNICVEGVCQVAPPDNDACITGEPNEVCCIRIVKRVCKRKQSSKHAKRNCRKRGTRKCRNVF